MSVSRTDKKTILALESKQSSAYIALRLAPTHHLSVTLNDFRERNIEERSLYVRYLFEQASNRAVTYDEIDQLNDNQKFVSILSCGFTFSFLSNAKEILDILCDYKSVIFDREKIYELDDGLYGIEVSPDTIFTYTSSQAAAHIPNLAAALEKNNWRTKSILFYKNEIPMLVLRGCDSDYSDSLMDKDYLSTPSELACDGNNVITQQLINYAHDLKRKKQLSPIEFPQKEGRGAVFLIDNVPFHSYNSYVRNDQLCEYMGLFQRNDSPSWRLSLRSCLPHIQGYVTYENLRKYPYVGYSEIPTISHWQKHGVYRSAIMMPFDRYIEICLAHQLSQEVSARIPREDGTIATDQEIKRAHIALQEYRNNHPPKNEHNNSFRVGIRQSCR